MSQRSQRQLKVLVIEGLDALVLATGESALIDSQLRRFETRTVRDRV